MLHLSSRHHEQHPFPLQVTGVNRQAKEQHEELDKEMKRLAGLVARFQMQMTQVVTLSDSVIRMHTLMRQATAWVCKRGMHAGRWDIVEAGHHGTNELRIRSFHRCCCRSAH